MRKNLIMLVTLVLLLLPSTYALGISPARTEVDYTPGAVNSYSFGVRGSPDQPVQIILRGELANYTEIAGSANFTLNDKGMGSFSVKLTIPELAKPGLHESLVGVEEIESGPAGVVSAHVAVLSQLWIRVPYPEKYLDFQFDAPKQVGSGGVMEFIITATSRGSVPVAYVSGAIEIFDNLGNSVALVPLSSASNLKFGESARLTASWPTTGFRAGNYKAVATVNYDGKSQQFEHTFTIGEMLLEIVNINASKILQNSITRIPILVTSKWNAPIPGAYATIDISYFGQQVKQLQTPSKTIQPWADDTLEVYWDTTGLGAGTYNADITLWYADKNTIMKKQFYIVESMEGAAFSITSDMLILIVLAVIVVALAIAYVRKRGQSGKRNYYGGYGR